MAENGEKGTGRGRMGLRRLLGAERRETLNPWVDGLTGLRGVAAAWVVLYHVWVHAEPRLMTVSWGGWEADLTPLFSTGWVGVDILFVLSGFLLAIPFAEAAEGRRGAVRMKNYYARRVLRVLPAYYIQVVLLTLLAHAGLWGGPADPGTLLLHGLMLHGLSPEVASRINGVYWTLPIEFAFYLVLPLIMPLLLGRRGRLWFGALVLGVLAYRLIAFQWVQDAPVGQKVWLMEQLPGRLDQFLFGAVAAVFALRRGWLDGRAVPSGRGGALALALVAAFVGWLYLLHGNFETYWEGAPLLYVWHMVIGVLVAGGILALLHAPAWLRWPLANPLVAFVGLVSYSLYLWHLPVIAWVDRFLLADHDGYLLVPLLAIAGPLSLLVAALSYAITERPFLRLRVRFGHRREARTAPGDGT